MESIEELQLWIKVLEQRNTRLNNVIDKERQARMQIAESLRQEQIKNARASAQIASLTEKLEGAQRYLEDAQSNIANGIDCCRAASSNLKDALQQPHTQHLAFPQNARQIVLPMHGEAQPKLSARVNPMVQGIQIRKPSIQLYRISSRALLEYSDNAASSSANAATAMTVQQAAVPQVPMENEPSLQEESASTSAASGSRLDPMDAETTLTVVSSPPNSEGRRMRRSSSRRRRH